jgi:siderophore synthetase component
MKRLSVERLNLDLRGITPATARSAARLLGPALTQALAGRSLIDRPAASIDTGRSGIETAHDSTRLASHIARQIAAKTSRGGP